MGNSSKATALRVAQATFEGLAPLLIQHGIRSPEAEALLRAICVHAAAKTQDKGRRPNVSRISVKTGVDRHTVTAILKRAPNIDKASTARRDVLSRVIDGWFSDPEYSDTGNPRDLDIGDPNSNARSVWTLVQRYAPGIWPRLIVDELIRVDHVETLASGQLRWRRPSSAKSVSKRSNREGSSELMRHAVHALFNDAARPDKRRAWRTAQSLEIDEQDLPLVRKMLRERLNTMFGWITDELNSVRWGRDNAKANSGVRVGISGFTFEETLPNGATNEIVKKAHRAKP